MEVSIHAPGRGATFIKHVVDFTLSTVSIHAPGRGATRVCARLLLISLKFQFTHPGGVRLEMWLCEYQKYWFQFTHPGGVRQPALFVLSSLLSFNSRTREGCDWVAVGRADVSSKFQFTHPGGVRPERAKAELNALIVSIHAPGRGATCPR